MFPAFFKSPAERAKDNIAREVEKLKRRRETLIYILEEMQHEVYEIDAVLNKVDKLPAPNQHAHFFPL